MPFNRLNVVEQNRAWLNSIQQVETIVVAIFVAHQMLIRLSLALRITIMLYFKVRVSCHIPFFEIKSGLNKITRNGAFIFLL